MITHLRTILHHMNPALAALIASVSGFMLIRFYYKVKPLIPLALRLALRRWRATRKLKSCSGVWPVFEPAGKPPEDWPGWPDGQEFAFVLTHDVESSRGLGRVKQLAELEMSLGLRSSFNFVPEGDYRVSEELRDYLTSNGFEVGVHSLTHDGKLYSSRKTFRMRAERINQYLKEWKAVGFRSGFMHHNLEWLKDLEVIYDASTFDTDPFEPQPDGLGTIFPLWVPKVEGGGYVELPYTLVQDMNLFIILRERTTDIWKKKLDWIVSRGGMALVNVHPDYMAFDGATPARDEYDVQLFADFLQWVKQNYAGRYWHALPKDLAVFYRDFCVASPGNSGPIVSGGAWGAGARNGARS
jgi:hypothetical protein